ncbi:OB-fold nucleic acid binding domain-containing protein [Nocardia huaxiensis]|uniref:OB-fold nucleic acid binding domain-containing protein n=1 Tax=Nocardia huaxiensis TaxID=2755382 RepID=UPI001C67B88E|nr:OB-fold nucleic acid binding domain-containing protein [Nocardia huaxiensis]
MTRTLCAELAAAHAARPDGSVTVEGWVHRRRQLSGSTFVVVRDRSGTAQVVATEDAVRQRISELPEETVVRVSGRLTANVQAPGGIEIVDPEIRPLSAPSLPTPVELWRPALKTGLPTLLDHAALTWRHPRRHARPGAGRGGRGGEARRSGASGSA